MYGITFLEGKKCIAIPAPFSVRLFEQDKDAPEDVDTIVEPDISVICEEYGPKDVAKVSVLDGCFIDLNKIYANL